MIRNGLLDLAVIEEVISVRGPCETFPDEACVLLVTTMALAIEPIRGALQSTFSFFFFFIQPVQPFSPTSAVKLNTKFRVTCRSSPLNRTTTNQMSHLRQNIYQYCLTERFSKVVPPDAHNKRTTRNIKTQAIMNWCERLVTWLPHWYLMWKNAGVSSGNVSSVANPFRVSSSRHCHRSTYNVYRPSSSFTSMSILILVIIVCFALCRILWVQNQFFMSN